MARSHLVSRQLSACLIIAEVSPLLRRRLQGRIPHACQTRMRPMDGCRGDFTPPGPHLFARPHRPPSRRGRSRNPAKRSSLARPGSVLRILSRRQRSGPGRQPSNRVDRPGRETPRAKRRITCRLWSFVKPFPATRRCSCHDAFIDESYIVPSPGNGCPCHSSRSRPRQQSGAGTLSPHRL